MHGVIGEPRFKVRRKGAAGRFAFSIGLASICLSFRDEPVLPSTCEERQADCHPGRHIVIEARIAMFIGSLETEIGISVGHGKPNRGSGLTDSRLRRSQRRI